MARGAPRAVLRRTRRRSIERRRRMNWCEACAEGERALKHGEVDGTREEELDGAVRWQLVRAWRNRMQ